LEALGRLGAVHVVRSWDVGIDADAVGKWGFMGTAKR
jgi:hypothetical protein